jgi:hypothetical protein
VRTIKKNDRQQTCAREREAKQGHARDRHLGQRDLAKVKICTPKASSRRKSEHGDRMATRLEHVT